MTKLETVHQLMVAWCMDALTSRDPETNRPTLTAAEASVIRAFLKDNDILQAPEEGTAIAALRDKLAAQGRIPKPAAAIDPLLDLGHEVH